MRTSTSPVASAGLIVSGVRATTSPVTVTTLSGRVAAASANDGCAESITHWVMP